MTRTADIQVPLADRAALAVSNDADLFVSIHHNATADLTVNFPIIYFDGAASENLAGVALAKYLEASFQKIFYRQNTVSSIASDFSIFPKAGAAVLRGTYGIPGVLAEASSLYQSIGRKIAKAGITQCRRSPGVCHGYGNIL